MVSEKEIAEELNKACVAMQDSGLRVGRLRREVRRLREENVKLRKALCQSLLEAAKDV